MRFIELNLIKLVKEKLVEKQVNVLACAIATLESEMLTSGGQLIPVTFMQVAYQGAVLSLNVKESRQVVLQMVEEAMAPIFLIQHSPSVEPAGGSNGPQQH